MLTRIAEGSADGVATAEEELDEPGGDESARPGDADRAVAVAAGAGAGEWGGDHQFNRHCSK